jgi:hypothetical protein
MHEMPPNTEIILVSGKYLLLPVPEESFNHNVDSCDGKQCLIYDVGGFLDMILKGIDIPPGNWQLIGKGDALTEEQWKGIVETEYIEDIGHFPIDYETEESDCSSYTESGLSLLRSHGMNENTIILKEKV